MKPVAARLPGNRLHLQHGPIDLVIGADGDREAGFAAARARFDTVLEELVAELPALRTPLTPRTPPPTGSVARRMDSATRPFAANTFVTRMAAVAGAVADTVLAAMVDRTALTRAYVNNGGDIALHLEAGQSFTAALSDHTGTALGQTTIRHRDAVRGIATSGRHGRSLSLGIADSVTVLARTAAEADVAATLIANATDLPGHPAITRKPARHLDEDSDLGDRPVVTHCGPLSPADTDTALQNGLVRANAFLARGRITGAALFLAGASRTTGALAIEPQRTPAHA